jgi:hypothetical protein
MSRPAAALLAIMALLVLTSCGPPGGGARTIEADTVPYDLLDPDRPVAAPSPATGKTRVPQVFWLAGDRVVAEATDMSCADGGDAVVGELLDRLTAGPSEQGRATGESSAIPPDSGLRLIGLVDGTAEVEVDPEASPSAERLPLAIGQIVLTVTSAPDVRSVLLVNDGEVLQVPLPTGALRAGPVAADDYVDLLPERLRVRPGVGCRRAS